MRTALLSIRDRLDRVGITLSGLCLVHCLAGLVLVTVLGVGGQWMLDPAIHRVGLALWPRYRRYQHADQISAGLVPRSVNFGPSLTKGPADAGPFL